MTTPELPGTLQIALGTCKWKFREREVTVASVELTLQGEAERVRFLIQCVIVNDLLYQEGCIIERTMEGK